MTAPIPTVPGVYEDRTGDMWILREDGRWQWAARRLPFGGITTRGTHEEPIDAEVMEKTAAHPESEVLPLRRLEVDDLPPVD